MSAVQLLGRYLPPSVKGFLRGQHRGLVLARQLRRLRNLPAGWNLSDDDARELIYGWGNESWSAAAEYVRGILDAAWQARGPILECGSGLTTLLLALVGQSTGQAVWSLEHNPVWAQRVRSSLKRHRATGANVCLAPLRSRDGYAWYTPPLERMPRDFALVVCDGPPGNTPGGRYGLLPEMRGHLAPGCTLLLDDAERARERAVLDAWSAELGVDYVLVGSAKPYARLTLPC